MENAERWAQQARKGSTRLAILQLVSEADRYGYEIVAEIKRRTDGALEVAEGNAYPALHELEKTGFISAYWKEVEAGIPPRKYYKITARGRTLHRELVDEWDGYATAIKKLLKGA